MYQPFKTLTENVGVLFKLTVLSVLVLLVFGLTTSILQMLARVLGS